jgi:hypothetical protein
MPIWTLETPPKSYDKIAKKAVATERGWEDARTREILVQISNLADRAGQANILGVGFDKAAYVRSGAVKVIVRYNEKVNVTAGANLNLSWTGINGDFRGYALAQLGVTEVVFDVDVAAAPLVLFNEAGTLFVSAQTIVGTIVDAAGTTPLASELVISAPIAAAAGTRIVV